MRLAALISILLFSFVGQANAYLTEQEIVQISDAWVTQNTPAGKINYCVNGNLRITYEKTNDQGIGWAHGWILDDGGQPVWSPSKCDISIQPGLSSVDRCKVRAHEIMHFVNGPQHDGPLSPDNEVASECADANEAKKTRRQKAVELIGDTLPVKRAWVTSCNKKVTRCVSRSKLAKYPRYWDIVGDSELEALSGSRKRANRRS